MQVIFLYRPKSEYARMIEDYKNDLIARYPAIKTKDIDVDSREGMSMTNLYDVVRYPAILIITEDGQLINYWQDEVLPTQDELISYLN